MFVRAIVLASLACLIAAKLDLPHPKNVQIESLVGFDGNGEISNDPKLFAGAVVIDGVSQANGLDMDCNNKFCSMMEYATTCKAIGLGVKKICARYLLGYKYGCNIFPGPQEVVNAPSICIPSVLRILPYLAQGAAGLQQLIGPYLDPTDFSTDTCGRTCFQNYQNASHAFYSTCRPQLNETLVPLAFAIQNFQEYRNQACAYNPAGQNCYSALMSLIPSPTAETTGTPLSNILTPDEIKDMESGSGIFGAMVEDAKITSAATEVSDSPSAEAEALAATELVHSAAVTPLETTIVGAPAIDLFNFSCNYNYGYANNMGIMGAVCQTVLSMDCCAATGITMVQQNPVGGLAAAAAGGAVDPTIFPPCLVQYLQKGQCGAAPAGVHVDLQNYCANGSIATTTAFTGTMFMPRNPSPPAGVFPFPNMYNKAAVLNMQGAVTAALQAFPGFANWPYLMNKLQPLQVQIIGYTYYKGASPAALTPLTPNNGLVAQPYGIDYTNATFGNFTFQVVLQDLNETTSQIVYSALRSQNFVGALNQAYTGVPQGNPPTAYVQAKTSMYPAIFGPEPIEFSAGFSLSASRGMRWMVTLALTLGVSAMLFSSGGGSDSRRSSNMELR